MKLWRQVLESNGVTADDRVLLRLPIAGAVGGDCVLSLSEFGTLWTAADEALDFEPTVLVTTPTDALQLSHTDNFSSAVLRLVCVTGEPGGSIASTRRTIKERLGACCVDVYALTETGVVGWSCAAAPGGIHMDEDEFGVEVDLARHGELLLTTRDRDSRLARYRTGDLVRLSGPARGAERVDPAAGSVHGDPPDATASPDPADRPEAAAQPNRADPAAGADPAASAGLATSTDLVAHATPHTGTAPGPSTDLAARAEQSVRADPATSTEPFDRPDGACACGSTWVRAECGILGRVDERVVVRGVELLPAAIEEVVRRHPAVREFAIDAFGDHKLAVRVEPDAAIASEGDRARVAAEVSEDLRRSLGVRVQCDVVPPGSLGEQDAARRARRFTRQ